MYCDTSLGLYIKSNLIKCFFSILLRHITHPDFDILSCTSFLQETNRIKTNRTNNTHPKLYSYQYHHIETQIIKYVQLQSCFFYTHTYACMCFGPNSFKKEKISYVCSFYIIHCCCSQIRVTVRLFLQYSTCDVVDSGQWVGYTTMKE